MEDSNTNSDQNVRDEDGTLRVKPQVVTPTEPVTPITSEPPVAPAKPKVPTRPFEEPFVPTDKSANQSGVREFFSTIAILLAALGVALFMITFVFRSYQVDGPSMNNTLQNADKLIIWKVPRSWARITHHPYIPKRGDIIVFTESGLSQFNQEDTKQLIKRVIGLPGDRVVVKDGSITIYNSRYPNGFKPDQTLPYGKNIPLTSGDIDVTLLQNQLFVSGDNRPDSLDSRAFGPIDADQVIGKLVVRLFPVSQAKAF